MSRWRSLLMLVLLWTGESAGFPTGSEAEGAETVAAGVLESSGTPGRGQRARCAGCSPELCAEAVGCRAGLVPDRCGCCLECGNSEGQPCDLDRTSGFYGLCGPDLKCTLDTSDLSRGEVPEPLCVCKSQEALCGSDGKTYQNICKFREAEFSSQALRFNSSGPCQTVPDIKRPPANLVTATGDSAIFPCEVFAFPMALSEWRKDGDDVILPGDDPRISVQMWVLPLCPGAQQRRFHRSSQESTTITTNLPGNIHPSESAFLKSHRLLAP